jgi:hypothetical protein
MKEISIDIEVKPPRLPEPVTARKICAVAKKHGINIKPSQLSLAGPIDDLGVYHFGLSRNRELKVWVIKERRARFSV